MKSVEELKNTIENLKNKITTLKQEVNSVNSEFYEFAHSKGIYILNPHQKESDQVAVCNFHCHSTNSDGFWEPYDMLRYYKAGGYDLIGIADHKYITWVDNAPLLYIQDCESYRDSSWEHWVMINIPKQEDVSEEVWKELLTIARGGKKLACYTKRCKELGILTMLAHPRAFCEDYYTAKYDFYELNNKGGRTGYNHEAVLAQVLEKTSRRIVLVNSDDCHVRPTYREDTSHSRIHYNGEKTVTNILDALKNGRCYPTIGDEAPNMKISVSERTVTVTTDVNCSIQIVSGNKILKETNGNVLNYTVSAGQRYIRVRAYLNKKSKTTNVVFSQILWCI